MTGVVVWFTGLPASGKTTLATRVRASLVEPCVLLDSDEVRDVLGAGGYTVAERDAFYIALAGLAALLARQGFIVLVAATAPRRAHRDHARAVAPRFIEVWMRAQLADVEARDTKGLYAKARRGEAPDLPGVGASYEPPPAPDVIASGGDDMDALEALLAQLR